MHGLHSAYPTMASSAAKDFIIPYTTNITLTPKDNPADVRDVVLRAGTPMLLGRASRSHATHPANSILFNSPVVSRWHAQLEASPGDVTIKDKGSTHGTVVNGQRLIVDRPFSLASGDVIKLGGYVTRGQDVHECVTLTYKTVDPGYRPNSPLPLSAVPAPSYGFRAPSSRGSDDESDAAFETSAFAEPAPQAQAKPNATPGSQERPIDLDQAPATSIIDLSQDDDEYDPFENVTIHAHTTTKRVFPSTIPESVPVPPAPSVVEVDVPPFSDIASSEAESVCNHNTGLAQLLNNADEDESAADSDDCIDYVGEEVESEGESEDLEDDLEDEIDPFERGWSEHEPVQEQDEDEPHSEPDSDTESTVAVVGTAKESSPELGHSFLTSSSTATVSTAQKPRYDPVRGSQPPPFGSNPPFRPVGMAYDHTTSSAAPYGSAFSSIFTTPYETTAGAGSYSTAMPYEYSFHHSARTIPPAYDLPMPTLRALKPEDAHVYEGASLSAPTKAFGEPTNCPNRVVKSFLDNIPAPPDTTASKARMDISGLVNSPATTTNQQLAQERQDEGSLIADHPRGGKRKAADMTEPEAVVPAPKAPKLSKANINNQCIRRRRRHESNLIHSVASGAAKIVGGAALGAVGTVAFLSSPYAAQLIEWLG